MGTRILAALVAALALSACSEPAPGPDIASLDQKCADVSDTGDMYRYCLQEGPEQVALISHHSKDVAAVTISSR